MGFRGGPAPFFISRRALQERCPARIPPGLCRTPGLGQSYIGCGYMEIFGGSFNLWIQQSLHMFLQQPRVTRFVSAQGLRDPNLGWGRAGGDVGTNQQQSQPSIQNLLSLNTSPAYVQNAPSDFASRLSAQSHGWESKALDSYLGSALRHEMNFQQFHLYFPLRIYIIFNGNTSSPSRAIRSFETSFFVLFGLPLGKMHNNQSFLCLSGWQKYLLSNEISRLLTLTSLSTRLFYPVGQRFV